MSKYICNPLNLEYCYQVNMNPVDQEIDIYREAADPSLILFKDKYYLFASMSLGVWSSDDLADWTFHNLPSNFPFYEYAPDAHVIQDYVYVCANNEQGNGNFYRTKDILNGPYEKIEGSFPFMDPNLFLDNDGRLYLYGGLSPDEPIWGIELDIDTMQPIGEKQPLISANPFTKGFERIGEDNTTLPLSEEELEKQYSKFLELNGAEQEQIDTSMEKIIKGMIKQAPYLEGAWMTKYQNKYYLQYSSPATQFNVYSDAVYVSNSPLGPFALAKNNPYSFKPGGFISGAGHGSTMKDKDGQFWHVSTMRISVNHNFERRMGLWPAGFDSEGELYSNQRYGDWPFNLEKMKADHWSEPDWYLLSYNKNVYSSSYEEHYPPTNAVNENIQSWWRAKTNHSGEWLEIDLGENFDVHAIQLNFADDNLQVDDLNHTIIKKSNRFIVEERQKTRWFLEGSCNGKDYFMIQDKSKVSTDLSHDLIVKKEGMKVRYIKLTIIEVPYSQVPCVSGFRVFGKGQGKSPRKAQYTVKRVGDIDMDIQIQLNNAMGHNILWGQSSDKLYHSYLTFDNEKRIGALVKGEEYFVRIDAFNENGITKGDVVKL